MSHVPIRLIYTPRKDRLMQVAGFMSGSGTNLIKIIERAKQYKVCLIFTDNKNSNGKAISEKFNIPLEMLDITDFYKSKGYSDKKNLSIRSEFDSKIVGILQKYDIDLIALAGYMSIITQPLLDVFDGKIINVHPADLSIKTKDGKRKYTGSHAVRDAILAGEKELRSTTHIVRREVDCGEILLISDGISVSIPPDLSLQETVELNQNRLKENGDWKIFPLTLQYIAEGRFEIDK